MKFEINIVAESDLPFRPGETEAQEYIPIQSEPDEDTIADGETEPFGWMDLRFIPSAFSRLIDADEVVLDTGEATLVLWYPLAAPAVRVLQAADGKAFTRGELMKAIDATYREIYAQETASQTSPTPPREERGQSYNRPASDGVFGISGHDLDDLGVSCIDVHKVDGRIWLDADMVS